MIRTPRTLVALALLLSFVAVVPGAFAAEAPAAAPAVAAALPPSLATALQLPSPAASLPQPAEIPAWLAAGSPAAGCGNTCILCERVGGLCCFIQGGGCFCSDFGSGCT